MPTLTSYYWDNHLKCPTKTYLKIGSSAESEKRDYKRNKTLNDFITGNGRERFMIELKFIEKWFSS